MTVAVNEKGIGRRPGAQIMTRAGANIGTCVLLFLCIVILTPFSAWGDPYTVYVDQDSYINEKVPTSNYGSETDLYIYGKIGFKEEALCRFDLSSVPSGSNIVSAKAYFYVLVKKTTPVNVHRVTDTWTEMGITWDNFAGKYDSTVEGSFVPSTNNQFVSVDITPLVQDWVDGVYQNYGLTLVSLDLNAKSAFASKEATNPSNHPYLEIITLPTNPDIILVKSVVTFTDPYNGETDPKAIPGATVLYSVNATNHGGVATDADTVLMTDQVPANTELFVGDINGAGSGPILFQDGTPISSLTYTFTSLDSAADDVEFSNDGGTSYTYTPVPDGDGFDSNVTHFRVTSSGAFNASDGVNHPSFTLKFKVRVK